MRILLVHRYYSPDVGAYPAMLKIMAKRFVEEGHTVTVFSTQPGYNDVATEKFPRRTEEDGIEVFRSWVFKENKKKILNRAVNVLLFVTQLIIHCLVRFRRYDLMTVASFPPTVAAMVIRWLAWINGSRYLYHCQDIYPEIARASGLVKRPWLSNLAMTIDRRNCRRASAVVTLSTDMTRTLTRRGLSDQNMHVINNFIIDHCNPAIEIDESLAKTPSKFRVLFAGNFGRFQHLDQLMLAAKELQDFSDIHFYFVGAGTMQQDLQQMASDEGLLNKTVFFRPFQPLKKVMRVIHESDLSVVSLAPGVIDFAYPSKTMSYVEAGCRILAVIESSSELAQLVNDADLGTVCESSSVEGISAGIESEYHRWKDTTYDRNRIRQQGEELFGQEAILRKWTSLLNQLNSNN